jgi:hypothetical protein
MWWAREELNLRSLPCQQNPGEPLCYKPFFQVGSDRRGTRETLSWCPGNALSPSAAGGSSHGQATAAGTWPQRAHAGDEGQHAGAGDQLPPARHRACRRGDGIWPCEDQGGPPGRMDRAMSWTGPSSQPPRRHRPREAHRASEWRPGSGRPRREKRTSAGWAAPDRNRETAERPASTLTRRGSRCQSGAGSGGGATRPARRTPRQRPARPRPPRRPTGATPARPVSGRRGTAGAGPR